MKRRLRKWRSGAKTSGCGRLKSMADDIGNRFVRRLRAELDAIVGRTLAIANAAIYRHKRERGQDVTLLDLTGRQRAAAEENSERLRRWTAAAVSFLRRRGAGGDVEIEQ